MHPFFQSFFYFIYLLAQQLLADDFLYGFVIGSALSFAFSFKFSISSFFVTHLLEFTVVQ